MARIKSLLVLLALVAQASATVTYVVGSCKPTFPLSSTFQSISAALAATPAPNVVEVCPGTYPEQLVIDIPVTLEGISDGASAGATIAVPSGGLSRGQIDGFGNIVFAQVLVGIASGEVNLSNLTVDGTNNSVPQSDFVAGVFYLNSAGTMNHLTTQNQFGAHNGIGVWLEGGSAKPSVTLENSNLQGFDNTGIEAETNAQSSELTATIKGNYLTAYAALSGIQIGPGATASVSGNLMPGSFFGISIAKGSVSGNTIVGAALRGISTSGASVTSNRIYNSGNGRSTSAAVWVGSSLAAVTGNTITQAGTLGNAIDFDCTAGKNVHSNTILGAPNGLINVPGGVLATETYYNVGTISSASGCP
jgi:hypothetical protein